MLTQSATQSHDFEPHKPARPMVIVKDQKGDRWLCDQGVEADKNLREQGCWNCGDLMFNRND